MPGGFDNRIATLTNGDRVLISAAAAALALLESHLEAPDQEWDVIYYLREVCLGRPIHPAPTRCLVGGGLLNPDGTVPPVLRSVVLSAVRGADRVLHLDSPFTNALDRKVATFMTAGDFIAAAEVGKPPPTSEDIREGVAFLRRILDKEPPAPPDNGPSRA